MDNLLIIDNLSVGYDETTVLRDLSFQVKRGQITVILGKSGCGKSTILKTVIGLLKPIQGEIRLHGEVVDYESEASVNSLYSQIGVLFQNGALLNSMTLFENVALPLRMKSSELEESDIRDRVMNKLAQVGLDDYSERYPAELSGGMRKRGALSRAMIMEPKLILCDEPSAGLDPLTAASLDNLMLKLKHESNVAIVVVTHELRSIHAIADYALVLNDGGAEFFGKFDDMKNAQSRFIQHFLNPMKGAEENDH